MKERPYHHLPDGTFRNPKGSPVIISRSGKFSYRIFSKLRKKVDLQNEAHFEGFFSRFTPVCLKMLQVRLLFSSLYANVQLKKHKKQIFMFPQTKSGENRV